MLKRFQEFVDANVLVKRDQKTLLAVSGGVDSVVLCHLFHLAGYNFGIAHANFQLRGKESGGDQDLVQRLAELLKVPFWHRALDTKKESKMRGISTQMAARDLRYQWLEELRSKQDFDLVAAAHHLDDSLETILLNLTKGTGIAGLRGIRPKVGTLIRPLLFAGKMEIIKYAQDNKFEWREDSSNQSQEYLRNVVRAKVVPILKGINPNLLDSLKATLDRLVGSEQIVTHAVDDFRLNAVRIEGQDCYIDKDILLKTAGGLVVLDQIVGSFGFNFQQTRQMWDRLQEGSGKVFDSPTHSLNIDRGHLIISPRDEGGDQTGKIEREDHNIDFQFLKLRCEIVDALNFQIPGNPSVACLDINKLTFPLTVRPWSHGDRFKPLGMAGQKKVSDFMIDQKIPVNLKKRLYVLTSDGNIAWIIGWRIDDRFKVTPHTKKIFQVRSTLRS